MNEQQVKDALSSANAGLEKGSDYISQSGIKSGYGWIIYLTFLIVGFLLGKFL